MNRIAIVFILFTHTAFAQNAPMPSVYDLDQDAVRTAVLRYEADVRALLLENSQLKNEIEKLKQEAVSASKGK